MIERSHESSSTSRTSQLVRKIGSQHQSIQILCVVSLCFPCVGRAPLACLCERPARGVVMCCVDLKGYGVVTISRLLEIISPFCRISSLLSVFLCLSTTFPSPRVLQVHRPSLFKSTTFCLKVYFVQGILEFLLHIPNSQNIFIVRRKVIFGVKSLSYETDFESRVD